MTLYPSGLLNKQTFFFNTRQSTQCK